MLNPNRKNLRKKLIVLLALAACSNVFAQINTGSPSGAQATPPSAPAQQATTEAPARLSAPASSVTPIAVIQTPSKSENTHSKEMAEEIQRINETMALLSARQDELKMRLGIATQEAELRKVGNGTPERAMDKVVPVVKSIEGVDGKLFATLAYGQGVQQTAKKGEKIAGGWQIAEINVNTVVLTKGKETVKLGFGFEPERLAAPAGQLPGYAPR